MEPNRPEELARERKDEQLRQQVQDVLQQLKMLRDEIRVELHLAGMEAKRRWEQDVQPRLAEAERVGREASENSRAALAAALEKLREFRETLRTR